MTRKPSLASLAAMRRTVRSYERFARDYDLLVDRYPPPDTEAALRRLAQCLPSGASVLEVGSGPGRDAAFLESLGLRVRRTDAVQAFLDLMAERGRPGELLNVVTDDLGGPYDGVLALCMLIHVDRSHIAAVLRKIHGALRPGGALLVSMRKGEGETTGDYHTVYWPPAVFAGELAAASLPVVWQRETVDSDGDEWTTYLARRAR